MSDQTLDWRVVGYFELCRTVVIKLGVSRYLGEDFILCVAW